VGRQLVQRAERWARGQGLERIVVRSNALRAEAHSFYPALEYVLAKTQRVYVKPLER
jgi:predicted N-acetyltransferase YhbS